MAAKEQVRLESVNGAEKQIKPVQMNALTLYDQGNARWRVVLPAGLKADELESPELWTVVSNKIRPFDSIEAIGHDGTFWAELLVLSAERGFQAVVKCLRVAEFEAMPKNSYSDLPTGYRIDYDPTTARYVPVRESDNVRMCEPQATREMARSRLVENAVFRK